MGTVVTLDLFDPAGLSTTVVAPYLANAIKVLHHADNIFSTWKPDSPLSRLRRGEVRLGEIPLEFDEVLNACRAAREISGGWFDPWSLPGGVDPTGYVKGWAAQRALDTLRASGAAGAMVNAAGDIASFGGPTGDQPFRVGIVKPDAPTNLACVIELSGTLATSGTYERGSHLLNPYTKVYRTEVASASVVGEDLGLADALATALAVGGEDVLERISRLTGYEAFTIGHDGARNWTANFPFAQVVTRP